MAESTLEALRRDFPVARHPMVRTHPDTGGEMLYVNPSFGRYVEEEHGRPDPASDSLLKTLY